KQFWKTPVAPKILYFGWKLRKSILPTKQELHRRHMSTEDSCDLCGETSDSWSHALILCPFATAVWRLGSTPWSTITQVLDDPLAWLI
ncbi:hypothetical protein M569_05275, partial [Genlisea aurea]